MILGRSFLHWILQPKSIGGRWDQNSNKFFLEFTAKTSFAWTVIRIPSDIQILNWQQLEKVGFGLQKFMVFEIEIGIIKMAHSRKIYIELVLRNWVNFDFKPSSCIVSCEVLIQKAWGKYSLKNVRRFSQISVRRETKTETQPNFGRKITTYLKSDF